MITLTNEDNMDLMKRYPDNYFELAIVDPPYGIGYDVACEKNNGKKYKGNTKAKRGTYKAKGWDSSIPKQEYFEQLFRVSKNQIIWGGNYMIKYLHNTPCIIVWNKNMNGNFADGELAWTSFMSPLKIFEFTWNGMIQGDMKNKEVRIHPTQKPVKLYEWLLMNYAKEGDKILDTHLGSSSIALACHNLGFDLVGCELDAEYYEAACKRLKQHQAQLTMF
jgi:site-specific DNA-methyltransferase (adenine-specific)